jgi:tRNA modification GTPase
VPVQDTIVALSTPPGRSGIGVVRLSGPQSLDIARALTRDLEFNPHPNFVTLRSVFDPSSDALLDQALVTYFKAPHSFTGEDVVELSCHGSPVLLTRLIDIALSLDARPASPGEFTLRALANGRLNLSQAEAIRDLIDAQTESAARQAARQLRGELSNRLQPIKDLLIEIIVPLESSLEFVEDDLPDIAVEAIVRKLDRLGSDLRELSSSFNSGRLLREGLKVVLAGRPNVGKSSVFNRLLSMERAIVTPVAGTTRDSLTERISLDGVPVQLTDTAGIRTSVDAIEVMGVERTRDAIADADLVAVILDGSQRLNDEDRDVLEEVKEARNLVVINKIDIGNGDGLSDIALLEGRAPVVKISAKSGEGFEALRAAIMRPFGSSDLSGDNFVITNARHFDLLTRAEESIQSAASLLDQRASEELVLVGLHGALRYLGQITGETTPDEILGQIFLTFCIGK